MNISPLICPSVLEPYPSYLSIANISFGLKLQRHMFPSLILVPFFDKDLNSERCFITIILIIMPTLISLSPLSTYYMTFPGIVLSFSYECSHLISTFKYRWGHWVSEDLSPMSQNWALHVLLITMLLFPKLTSHCLILCSFLLCMLVPGRKAPPLTSWMALGTLYNLPVLGFLLCEIGTLISTL